MDTVPCVEFPQDVGEALSTRCGGRIRSALEEFGFVRITQHGIESGHIERTYRAFARFFALSTARKERYSGCAAGQRGFTGFGVEHARNHPVPDQKEFFHVGQPTPADPPLAAAYPANVWPEELPELEAFATSLFARLEHCARRILHAVAQSYGLPGEHFASLIDGGNSLLRAAHYPCILKPPPGALRAAPHEDINLITLLCGATGPGLEIRSRGHWIPIAHEPGEIVVDAGDMLSRLTNGVMPATTHRVVTPPGPQTARIALPFFAHPRPECDLTAKAPFVSTDRPRRQPPITAGRYLEERLREIGLTGR